MMMYYLVFSGQVGRLHDRISTDLLKYNAVLPANTRHSPNTVSMLGQRRRRWPTLKQRWLNALCLLGGVTAMRPVMHVSCIQALCLCHRTDLI